MLEQPTGTVIANLAKCTSLDALYQRFNEEIMRLGLDFYSMAIVPLDPKFERAPLFHGTFPRAYIDGYQALGAHTIDPYLEVIAKRTTPVLHADMLKQFQATEIGRKLTVLAETTDVRQGFMVPLPTAGMARGVGFWARGGNIRFQDVVENHAAYLVFLATCFAAATEDLGFAPRIAEPVMLTRREKSILSHCAEGFSNPEIATHLGISERTVRFHLGNAYRKLEATGRAQALTRALRLDLIDAVPPDSPDSQHSRPVFLP
ncbi:MAG: LuxR C-terminal-related transcriptional regulator [Alphaproteobacteria bacterium]|nr:LuxR C-terminal-related transcriptional regulator [Alphaproteobacteria bacterium]